MAKQSGIHQLRGKIRGMSYYGQKGVQDGLVRKINEGLSTRVKNDAAYANTRLNAAEFGTAGSFAGAVIRSISEKKRAMMKDFATGDLAKVVRAEFLKDDTHVWGKRQFVGNNWRETVQSTVAQYAKLPWTDHIGASVLASLEAAESGSTGTCAISAPDNWGSLLAAKGATSVQFEVYICGVGFIATGDAPFLSETMSIHADTFEESLGSQFTHTTTQSTSFEVEELFGPNRILNFLVVAKPMKEVGSQKYILQELCTYSYLVPEVQG